MILYTKLGINVNYLEMNKKVWDSRTNVHVKSKFYDVESFVNGKSSLNSPELKLLGNVKGKSILHLQCHFGQDTLSLARMGAHVTGVDLSSNAISHANMLKETLGLNAKFIESDVCQFSSINNKQFDIVYTSYGVLSWLSNLTGWANTIESSLKTGGQFHLVEFHPINDLLSGYSYFSKSEPDVDEEGTYTENCDGTTSTMATWSHSISDVINALLAAGLSIEVFSESPYSPYNCFKDLDYVPGCGYKMVYKDQLVPLIYSLTARKTAGILK
jgi:SAM-dependent methyltransferase